MPNLRFQFLFFADVGIEPLKPIPRYQRVFFDDHLTTIISWNRHGSVS